MNVHVVADQGEVLEFLGNPETYGISEPVKRIDTQGAVVFLAGRDAYKVKRAVRFPFSTPEKRKLACDREVEINRDNAPSIYLDLISITRSTARLATTGLELGRKGEVVEWASICVASTRMRRSTTRRNATVFPGRSLPTWRILSFGLMSGRHARISTLPPRWIAIFSKMPRASLRVPNSSPRYAFGG
ncbi:hypothetical protein SAMN05444161_9058 [Rhizobiales bacterium GAS191]|nr:hypothetical protein SAMN05444161_9058 [Rhizobiales bacterium GAS191]